MTETKTQDKYQQLKNIKVVDFLETVDFTKPEEKGMLLKAYKEKNLLALVLDLEDQPFSSSDRSPWVLQPHEVKADWKQNIAPKLFDHVTIAEIKVLWLVVDKRNQKINLKKMREAPLDQDGRSVIIAVFGFIAWGILYVLFKFGRKGPRGPFPRA